MCGEDSLVVKDYLKVNFEDNDRKIYELQNKITTLLSSQNNLINQELI